MARENDQTIHVDGWCRLASRVVRLAADDYRFTLRRIKRDRRDRNARREARRLEYFFRSGWFHVLLDIDGEELIQRLREEIRNER